MEQRDHGCAWRVPRFQGAGEIQVRVIMNMIVGVILHVMVWAFGVTGRVFALHSFVGCSWVINESLLDAKYGSGNIRVLAEHEIKGVMVYEFGDLFVCNFSVLDKYPESMYVLRVLAVTVGCWL